MLVVSEAGETAEMFVDLWVDEVRRLVRRETELRSADERMSWAAERLEEWSPTEFDLHESFRRLWAAQHHLVWATHQLERWRRRLARERGEPEPPRDPVLDDLRNALEHLDEAVLDDVHAAVAGDDPRMNRSLRRLPQGRLHVGSGGRLMFQLLDPAEIERRVWTITTAAERAMTEAEDWVADYGWPDDPEAAGDGPA